MHDFEGWATKNDLQCADGLIIRKNAFKVNDGKRVPLVWNHQHTSVGQVLGHAILENRDEGVYAYCSFNNTSAGRDAKETVSHGDVVSLSVWANNVQQKGADVIHGVIREVSLVLAGANPGAFIESVISHGCSLCEDEEECILCTGEGIILHADTSSSESNNNEGVKNMPPKNEETGSGKTVQEVLETLNDDQKKAVGILIGQVIEDAKDDDEEDLEEGEEMKHNLFEGAQASRNVISHSDMETILSDAKRLGSLKESVYSHMESGVLSHGVDATGMDTSTGSQTYGFNDPSMLFPDFKVINETPEWISRNMDWVSKVMSKVHHTPFSRVKSLYANITEEEARAKGYIKGKQKKEEVFTTLKRTTSPQTIYKKQKLDRDDIIDITGFDVLAWIRAEMRVMLDEEVARAILIGDGRPGDSEDKIKEDCVRPVVKDVPLFNTTIIVKVDANVGPEVIAAETIKSIIRGRKHFKGSGKPDFWTTEDVITEMLLLEDKIGQTLYKTEAELATKLRVSEIIPVEPMEGQQITISGKTYELLGTITNLADYNVGADKGGEVNLFDDFDIDYNQQKYLIETRMSGALVKPYSALTILLDKSGTSTFTTDRSTK